MAKVKFSVLLFRNLAELRADSYTLPVVSNVHQQTRQNYVYTFIFIALLLHMNQQLRITTHLKKLGT